jgi:hypothetical protein
LGATLYTACEGRPPHHRGDTMAVLAAIMTQDPDPPRNAGELGPVLYGLLLRDPVQRLRAEQAEEMLAAIASGGTARTPNIPAQNIPVQNITVQNVSVPDVPTSTLHGPSHGDRKGVVLPVLAGALAALVIVGVAAFLFWPDGGSGRAAEAGQNVQSPPVPAEAQTQQARPSDAPTTSTSASAGSASSLPGELRQATGPGGFTIGVPEGWTRREQGNSTFWTDPATGAYVQVDRTAWEGDPYQHWQEWERNVIARNVLPGYRRVDLVSTDVDAGGTVHRAADIEFTWNGKHGIDRGVRAGGRTYAVFVAVPASRWNEYRSIMNNVIESFRP